MDNGTWLPLKFARGDSPKLSHICFPDDIVLVAEETINQAHLIKKMSWNPFVAIRGQKINLSKSRVFFSNNVPEEVSNSLSQALDMGITKDVVRYLGVPILHQRSKKDSFNFILVKMGKKMSNWKASSLSFAGRVTLAQASLSSIPGYVMQATVIPSSICEEAEKLCQNFIWG